MADSSGASEFNVMIARLERRLRELDVRPREVAALLEIAPDGWPLAVSRRWTSVDVTIEKRMRRLLAKCDRLLAEHGDDAMVWLRTPSAPGEPARLQLLIEGRW